MVFHIKKRDCPDKEKLGWDYESLCGRYFSGLNPKQKKTYIVCLTCLKIKNSKKEI